MVQPNTEARPRRSRTRRGEEQAPLVESHLSVTNDVIMDGEGRRWGRIKDTINNNSRPGNKTCILYTYTLG